MILGRVVYYVIVYDDRNLYPNMAARVEIIYFCWNESVPH